MARQQWRTLAGGMFFGIVWMSAQAVMPAVIGHAIDDGVAAKDREQLVEWAEFIHEHGTEAAIARVDTAKAEREAAKDRAQLLDE